MTHNVSVSNSKKSLKHVRLASVRILTPWCVRDESALDVAAPCPPNTQSDDLPSPVHTGTAGEMRGVRLEEKQFFFWMIGWDQEEEEGSVGPPSIGLRPHFFGTNCVNFLSAICPGGVPTSAIACVGIYLVRFIYIPGTVNIVCSLGARRLNDAVRNLLHPLLVPPEKKNV